MKEIFLGLLVISGFIVILYSILLIAGVCTIFLSNLFSSTSHTTYNWDNIKREGGRGLLILTCVLAVLIVAHLFGSAITL